MPLQGHRISPPHVRPSRQPLLLYAGAQYAGSSNESYFNKLVLPSEVQSPLNGEGDGGGDGDSSEMSPTSPRHSCLAAAVHLTDDGGEVALLPILTESQPRAWA